MKSLALACAPLAASLKLASVTAGGSASVQLNEVYLFHNGVAQNQEFIELTGTALTSLDGFMLLVVDGDAPGAGVLDSAWDLTGQSIAVSGRFVLGGPGIPSADMSLAAANTLEDGSSTYYLISTSNVAAVTALVGTNVDPNGDGITSIPTTAGVVIVDSVGVFDGDAGDLVFDGAPSRGPEYTAVAPFYTVPPGVFRGSDAPNAWCDSFHDASHPGTCSTPGAANVACPPTNVYCGTGTCGAMAWSGIPSASLQYDFVLYTYSVAGNTSGLIFYGVNGPAAVSWGGAGTKCVHDPVQRTGTQTSTGTQFTCDGMLTLDWNAYQAGNPGALGNPFASGTTVWSQGWFRTPWTAKTTMLSNALEFTLVP